MITLALIPFGVFIAVLAICLRAKHRYAVAVAKLTEQSDTIRQQKLAADEDNDRQLVAAIVGDAAPIAELVATHRQQRANLLPAARCADAAAWLTEDLLRFCRDWKRERLTSARSRLVLRTSLTILVAVVLGVLAAAWRYSTLSSSSGMPPAPAVAAPDDDPFASGGAN